MVFVPFIYFTLLTLYWWKKHEGLDICVYMSGLYAFTSLCAVVLYFGEMLGAGGILYDDYNVELNVLPTILYCGILTLSILPFSMIYKQDIKTISPSSPFILELASWFLILISMLNLYLVADSTADILSGDLAAVRTAHYDGLLTPAQIKAETMPSILRYLYYFNTATLLALPIAFYYLCFENKPWWFKGLLFFASLSLPIAGIQTVDRTEFTFYAMMFIFCLIVFHRFFSKKLKRRIILASVPVMAMIVTYMVAVSLARFDSREGGAGASALQYAGQGYLNFCYFWEHTNSDYATAEREFPLFYHTIKHIDSDGERRMKRSGKQGFFISVFPTFIGDLYLDITIWGLLSWISYYVLFTMLVIRRSHREEFDISEILAIFLLAVIPIFGIFYYRYFSFTYTLMLLFAALIYIFTQIQIVYKPNENISGHSNV